MRSWRARAAQSIADRSGQTTTEYLMILGLLTAMIIALTKIIVPGMTYVVVTLAKHVAIFMSSAG
ncbi:MAG: hypothetical protein A3H96_15920 [Acidobacteria bacterium RIFCSPLOWO2_02_FULL_67_36]|nr:MAG: hypothetical protein A3H96_15920 [Acidobacteria bacterium RIFCSPLOWO2_02_FULL_67_36]OFW22105.1 MAG: hypothetical protein A3G21_19140 [Acidobacteria bacterium RIFCSPLOWO2_12_FULL_66_21]